MWPRLNYFNILYVNLKKSFMFYVLFWVLLRNIAWEPATQQLWVNLSDGVEESQFINDFFFFV